MKEGESEKEKTYGALVWTSRALSEEDVDLISNTKDLAIQQATPVRVLHRRAALTRERSIIEMRCHPIPGRPNYAFLVLRTSAGTYIKEFVHGDFGRTLPNLGSLLGCSAEILQLDVLDIHLDFL
uniref:tRNA pseudouridine(55) synthase n=2 Tax=Tetraselmis sp. GSL018 TaxID=582737 RepID=A0A061RSU6_9CHLO